MTTTFTDTGSERPPAQAQTSPTRPWRWSLRRELWESRSIVLAPPIVASLCMFGFVISTIGMPHRRRDVLRLPFDQQRHAIGEPYSVVAFMLLATAFLVGVFYCIDALHGERRDRSILFWKSMPVSDRTAVLSKLAVPMAVLPLYTWVLVVVLHLAMLFWTTLVLLPSGLAFTTFSRVNLILRSVALLYGLITVVLWHAPVYAWLLLISAWARRAPLVWAVLPWLALMGVEWLAFHTKSVATMLRMRLFDFGSNAFAFGPGRKPAVDTLSQLTPGRFLSTPGLWIGLVLAVFFLAAAVRLRRDRGPI